MELEHIMEKPNTKATSPPITGTKAGTKTDIKTNTKKDFNIFYSLSISNLDIVYV